MQAARFVRSICSSARAASHVGSAPIPYPSTVTLTPTQGLITITGPKGARQIPIAPFVRFTTQNTPNGAASTSSAPSHPHELVVSVENPDIKVQRATWGLSRALIANAITGLTDGFAVSLKLVGVGFRAAVEPDPSDDPTSSGQRLNMKLNFAHNVYVSIPKGIVATTPQPTKIVLRGTDKQQIGQFAAKIRAWRKPEPYKGKGIFVGDETIKLKDVKKK